MRFIFLFLLCPLVGMAQQMHTESWLVAGVCGMCEQRIEQTILEAGAASADWDLETQMLSVVYDANQLSRSDLESALIAQGHDTEGFKASDSVYQALHECCKYREFDDYIFADVDSASISRPGTTTIGGTIYEKVDQDLVPLYLANVFVKGSKQGTTTDEQGLFELDIPISDSLALLEVSYVGMATQTVEAREGYDMELVLETSLDLAEVEIVYRKRGSEISMLDTRLVEELNEKEFAKAACCNLSESFETNPSVESSMTDAVTGVRQIQMLGLTGANVQFTQELIPTIRGLSTTYGLLTTPGPWIESIQIIKGTGSVVHGFESNTGQINLEMRKPDQGERLFVNGFANRAGRIEGNIVGRAQINDQVSTSLFLHGRRMSEAQDNNSDGFTDMPLEDLVVVSNRWKFAKKKNLMGQVFLQMSQLRQEAGTIAQFKQDNSDNAWLMDNDIDNYSLAGKMGYIFPGCSGQSLGLRTRLSFHDQTTDFGVRRYEGEQWSYFASLAYLNAFSDAHSLTAGLSYQGDWVEESLSDLQPLERDEQVAGAYAEYTNSSMDRWTFIPGARVDYHNDYGVIFVPRLHSKFQLSENTLLRFAAGRSWRTANILAENIGLLASSRQVIVDMDAPDQPYGLSPEMAWNYGVSLTQDGQLWGKAYVWGVDFYRTHFENQIIVDRENAREISFYNLEGQSYSNSLQVRMDYEPVSRLDMRIAYRLFDVQQDFRSAQLRTPLVAQHRGFVHGSYETENGWSLDATYNWIGRQRLPSTKANPEQYRRTHYSPSYSLLHAQISKKWKDSGWEVYLGGDNLTNYQQDDAIIDAENPFGQFFDASLVWAPMFGANVYLGFRYRLY